MAPFGPIWPLLDPFGPNSPHTTKVAEELSRVGVAGWVVVLREIKANYASQRSWILGASLGLATFFVYY